jgi:hypothetical protein
MGMTAREILWWGICHKEPPKREDNKSEKENK